MSEATISFLPPKLKLLKILSPVEVDVKLLERLCAKAWDGTTAISVLQKIAQGRLEAYSTGEGLVLLETVDWPRGRELWLHGLVGRGILKSAEAILSDLKAIAAFKACSMIGGDGIPKGWKKFGPTMGFYPVSTHYVLEL